MSNGTATGTGSSASISMSSYNHATMYSVWTRGSFDYPQDSRPTLTVAARTNQTGTIYDSVCEPADAVAGHLQLHQLQPRQGATSHFTRDLLRRAQRDQQHQRLFHARHLLHRQRRPGDPVRQQRVVPDLQRQLHRRCKTTGTTFILTQTTGNNSDIGGVSISSMNNVTLNAAGGPSAGSTTIRTRASCSIRIGASRPAR